MCRLCAITATQFNVAVPARFKAELVHECMLRSSNDEGGQRDGWGVTDMHVTYRHTAWYMDSTPVWLPRLSTSGFLMSHLRKASMNTGHTLSENHPYVFDINGERLIAAHNGFFEGTSWTNWATGNPNTDSYRALSDLAAVLRDDPELTVEKINAWLSLYGEGSHYAVLLHWRDRLYALRGKTRTLAALPIGNGYLIHTNINLLHFMRRYVEEVYRMEMTAPSPIEDNTLVVFPLGSREVEVHTLAPQHKQPDKARWQQGTRDYSPKLPAVVNVNEKEGDGDSRYVVAESITPRRSRTEQSVSESAGTDADEFTLKDRRKYWGIIAGRLSPLRRDLSLMWIANTLGYIDDNFDPCPQTFLMQASRKEFELVMAVMTPENAAGKFMKPFSPAAMLMINLWNHLVKDGHDIDAHQALFGNHPFWLNSTFTATTEEPYKAVERWQKYVLSCISVLSSEEVRSMFDGDLLRRMIDDAVLDKHIRTASTAIILSAGS